MFKILQIFHKSNDKLCVNELSYVEHKKWVSWFENSMFLLLLKP
jgi:hypothetical protein